MRLARLLMSLSPVLLAGCIHGGNIKGDFVCKAPGGTCAPMSNIDASALASLGTSPTPAALPGPGAADPLFRPVPLPPGTVPQRAGERVLKVVFPAHVDASGVYRDEATAYAAVERPGWSGPSAPARSVAVPASLDELVAAASPSSAPASPPPAVRSSASLTGVPISPATAYTYPGQSAAPAPQPPRTAAAFASSAPLSIREVFAAASAPPLEAEPLVTASASDDAAAVQVPTRHRVKWKGRWYWRPGPPRSRTRAAPVEASMIHTAALNRQQIQAVSASPPSSTSAVFSPPPSVPAPPGSAAEIAADASQGVDAGQLENPQ